MQLRGVDESRQPFHLFKTIQVHDLRSTMSTFPSDKQTKQPYRTTIPEEAKIEQFKVELQSMGHYAEKNITITVNMEELQHMKTIMYEMNMDSQTGKWEIVVMHDQDRNAVGVAEFTQK